MKKYQLNYVIQVLFTFFMMSVYSQAWTAARIRGVTIMKDSSMFCKILLVLGLIMSPIQANAALFSATLQPVQLCQHDGSNCYFSTFDRSEFQDVFSQAGITFDYLPDIQLNSVLTPTNPDGYYILQDQFEIIELLDLPNPDGVPDDVLVNYFGSSLTNSGLSRIGDNTSFTREADSSMRFAHLLAREVGWSLLHGNFASFFFSSDPLNLFCNPSIVLCEFNNPNFGIMTDVQIATMQSSQFVNLNPIPVPAAVWLFGSGLIGLVGVARRKKS